MPPAENTMHQGAEGARVPMMCAHDMCTAAAGGSPARVEAARAIVTAGVAVMGHVGLTPQSISVIGELLLSQASHGLHGI